MDTHVDKGEQTTPLLHRRQSGGIICLKVFLHAFNVFFLLIGIVLVAAGIWTWTSLKPYFQLSSIYHSYSSWILIAVGVFITAVACSAFYCTWNNKKTALLNLYGSWIMIIVIAELGGGIAALILRNKISAMLRQGLVNNMQKYGQDESLSKAWDDVQQALECCGVNNYSDWKFLPGNENSTFDSLPKSCFGKGKQSVTISDSFQEGCYQLMEESVLSSLGIIVGIAFGFIGVQLLGEVLAFCLASKTRDHVYEEIL